MPNIMQTLNIMWEGVERNDSPLNASEDFHKSLQTKLHWHYELRK